jgi:hypothetical protein
MPEPKPEYITEHQARLTASGQANKQGTFEILCITAGNGNGWEFPADVLEQSLQLWNGAHCFIDHAWLSRSVRDLAGQITDPVWDADAQGVRATLKAFGPGGQLLTDFGREVLTEKTPPRVGFSADILFKATGTKVKEVLRVISLDLVCDPARGGAFLRALNQNNYNTEGVITMPKPEENKTPPDQPADEPVLAKLQADQEAMRTLLNEQERQTKLDQALKQAEETRVQMCSYLLESGLSASKLPAPIQERIRKQFKDKIFEASELQEVIQDNRQMLSDLTAQSAVSGPGRISAMYNEGDKLQAAVDALFGAPREGGAEALKTARLSGIRELYLMLTGDQDMHGGYHPDRVQLATTADFTGLVKNALNKIVVNTWDQLGRAGYDWWKHITVQEHFGTLQSITGTLVGTVGALPEVEEGAEYTELVVGDSPETASFTKYGGYIPLTLELIDRDETRKLKAYARELGSAGLRKISSLVSAIFTASSGVGPTMADTGALFNATAVTTAGGHANLLTAALAINTWDLACAAVYNQPMLIKNAATYYGTGPKMAINPKYLLVPRALQNTAWQLLNGTFVREADYVYDNVLKGSAVPITVPEWTDANNWAAVCDPVIAPAIYVGERFGIMPEIFVAGNELSPAVFTNDEHRLKVRHFLAVWVNDFRPLHKSNVA